MTTSRLLVSMLKDTGRVRDHNEDDCRNFAIDHATGQYHLLVVADGMGGHADGEVASKLAIDTLAQFVQYGAWTDPARGLRDGFNLANERVHAQDSDMGTTLTAVLFKESTGEYWWANVGDSRAYLLSQGELHQLSRDHSEIQTRVDAGQLTVEEARLSKGRNVLLKAIGPSARVEADVEGPFELLPGQRLLLCSDGLHGMVNEADIAALAQHELQNAPKDLVAAANVAGGRDNITALIAALSDGEATQWVGPAPLAVARQPRRFRPNHIAAVGAAVGVLFVSVFGIWMLAGAGGDDDDKGDNVFTPVATTSSSPGGAGTNTPTPVPTRTFTPTSTPTPTSTSTPSSTPVPTSTPTRSSTPVPTSTPTPSSTPVPPGPTSVPVARSLIVLRRGADPSKLDVSWGYDPVSDVSFVVKYYPKVTPLTAKEQTVAAAKSVTISEVPNNGKYCVVVTATISGISSAPSEEVCEL